MDNRPRGISRSSRQLEGRVLVDSGRRFSRWPLLTAWSFEALSFLLSLLAFAAIVITVSVHAGRPLPQWPHLISINALIAIFTAILKAALLVPIAEGLTRLKWLWFTRPRKFGDLERFDSASRGPWGSLVLLFRLQGRHVAALGGLVTVLTTAVDPFSQQIIRYYACNIPIAGALATVPISNYYTAGFHFFNGNTGGTDANMTAAVYMGLINPPANATVDISANCQSGNCTISASRNETYSSIAMCSQCIDISDSIQNSTAGSFNKTGTLNYTLPSGAEIGPGEVLSMSVIIQTNEIENKNQDLATFDTVLAISSDLHVGSWTPLATRCALRPCVNTYNGNVTNGVLQESLVASRSMELYGEGAGFWYSLALNQTVRNGKQINCASTPQAQLPNDICQTFGSTLDGTNSTSCWPQDCVFTLGQDSTSGIQNLLSGLINGSTVSYIAAIPVGNPWSVTTWNQGQTNLSVFQQAYAGLAAQMTSVMRQKGDNSTLPLATGTVLTLQTCISVRWSWLSFPATLLLLTAIFFVTTVGKTAMSDTNYMWKSSSLALLFHGLGSDVPQRRSGTSLPETEDAASQLVGRLRITSEGFAFSEVDAADDKGAQ